MYSISRTRTRGNINKSYINIVISFSINSALVNSCAWVLAKPPAPASCKRLIYDEKVKEKREGASHFSFPPPSLVISRPKRTVPDFQGRTEEAQINRQDVFRRGQLPQIEEIFYRPWQGKKVDRNPPQALQFMRGNGADGIFLKRDLNERICGRN